MQVAKRAFLLNPRPKFGLPFLTRFLGYGHIPCVLELRHPALPRDAEDDAAFYRGCKPRIGAPGMSLANGEKLSLVNDAGDGKWEVRYDMGANLVVPAEEVCIGLRTSDAFLYNRFLNSEAGQAAFSWVWPGHAVCSEVLAEGPRSVSGLEIDPSLCARSLFELAHQLKTGKVDYESLLWHEDPSCLQTLDGFVQVGLVAVETEEPGTNAVARVPLFVSEEAHNLYGRSLLPGGHADWVYTMLHLGIFVCGAFLTHSTYLHVQGLMPTMSYEEAV